MRDLKNIPEGECTCSVCGITKDNKHYSWYKNRFTKDGYRLRVNTNCDDCRSMRSKEVKRAEKIAEMLGRGRSTLKDGDPCDCCGRPVYKKRSDIPDGVDGRWSFQCDHDHETGEFRGWVCKSCNTGPCSEKIDTFLKTAKYLGYDVSKMLHKSGTFYQSVQSLPNGVATSTNVC